MNEKMTMSFTSANIGTMQWTLSDRLQGVVKKFPENERELIKRGLLESVWRYTEMESSIFIFLNPEQQTELTTKLIQLFQDFEVQLKAALVEAGVDEAFFTKAFWGQTQ